MTFICSRSEIRHKLIEWYNTAGRVLPWRETRDPYAIWLSEVILQQTRVDQGMSYYHRFLQAYPTVQDLASASEDEVLHLWQGLGYYSRGRNLLKAARIITDEYKGVMPSDYKSVRALPGIGDYTAAAIMSFAYNIPHATVDGNIYRVLSRLCAIDTPIDSTQGKKIFQKQADLLLDPKHPGAHNQAIMELGALCCTPKNPQCDTDCPLPDCCAAYKLRLTAKLPVKQGKVQVKDRYFHYFFIKYALLSGQKVQTYTFIKKRPAGDVWQGLYEVPLIETPSDMGVESIIALEEYQAIIRMAEHPSSLSGPLAKLKYILTHRRIYADLYLLEFTGTQLPSLDGYEAIPITRIDEYAFPQLIKKLFNTINFLL